jgi:hypothetical protein
MWQCMDEQKCDLILFSSSMSTHKDCASTLHIPRFSPPPRNTNIHKSLKGNSELYKPGWSCLLAKQSHHCFTAFRYVLQRISIAKAVMMKLTKFWKDRNISKVTKIRLMHSSYVRIWNLDIKCKLPETNRSFWNDFWRRMIRIPWVDRRTNESILEELQIQTRDKLLSKIQRGIIKFFGHIIRQDGLEKLVIQGKVNGKRKRGRSINRYIDQIAGLTGLSIYNLVQAEDREAWRVIANRHTNGSRRPSMDND